jgi:hypothetical protein
MKIAEINCNIEKAKKAIELVDVEIKDLITTEDEL